MSSGRTGKVKRNWKWAENDTYETATDKDCELIVDVSTHIWYITSKINWLQRFRCGASPDAFCTFCYRNISIEKKTFLCRFISKLSSALEDSCRNYFRNFEFFSTKIWKIRKIISKIDNQWLARHTYHL